MDVDDSTTEQQSTEVQNQCCQNLQESRENIDFQNNNKVRHPGTPTKLSFLCQHFKSVKHVPAEPQRKRPLLEQTISQALLASPSGSNLIGDFTLPYCLPLVGGRHCDLKSIAAGTLRMLIQGEFAEHVSSFKVIDCRYPYEFAGGHIIGAVNLYTNELLLEELVKNAKIEVSNDQKRNILVFHCEFSSVRGPKL